MPTLQNILVPVDFSSPSRAALEYAVELAEHFEGASVHLLHVDAIPTYGLPDGSILDGSLRDAQKRQMKELAAEFEGRVEITERVEIGVPYAVIVERAREADLVVIGTHGRTGFEHLLLGSVAERVVRLSPVPVLTVRPRD